jgi:hypothetical protein
MGNYNPRAPIILGEEWVPIRPDVVQFPTGDNVFEVGHGFTLLASRTLSDARFYVENPTLTLNAQLCHIYPAGTEDKSGPVQSVIIPVSAAQVTGAQITPSASATIVTNLANPSDTSYVAFQQTTPTPAATPQYLALFFATNSYAQQLNGKRILAVNLLYSGYEYNITTTYSVWSSQAQRALRSQSGSSHRTQTTRSSSDTSRSRSCTALNSASLWEVTSSHHITLVRIQSRCAR